MLGKEGDIKSLSTSSKLSQGGAVKVEILMETGMITMGNLKIQSCNECSI